MSQYAQFLHGDRLSEYDIKTVSGHRSNSGLGIRAYTNAFKKGRNDIHSLQSSESNTRITFVQDSIEGYQYPSSDVNAEIR